MTATVHHLPTLYDLAPMGCRLKVFDRDSGQPAVFVSNINDNGQFWTRIEGPRGTIHLRNVLDNAAAFKRYWDL